MPVITFSIEGDQEVMDAALAAFCAQTGWIESSGVTQLQHARASIRQFIMDNIRAYNIRQAEAAAASAAAAATAAALDTTTMTINWE